jgi:hypothetical protein
VGRATRLRAYDEKPGLFAVSRFDPATGAEVLVAFNTSDRAITAQVAVEPGSLRLSAFRGLPRCASAPGSVACPARLWLCHLRRRQGHKDKRP